MTREEIKKEQDELFKQLVQLNVNDHTETKNDLTYLSWAWAWQEFKKACPDAEYSVKKFTNPTTGITLPYIETDIGYMVFTEITANGVTHEMWLPVMDGANKTMKKEPYKYIVGKGEKAFEKSVEAISMFDINKTIMRCLTKNIAMFGLGLYIYAGEDLPVEFGEPCTAEQVKKMKDLKVNELNVCKRFKVNSLEELTFKQATYVISSKEKALETEGGKE